MDAEIRRLTYVSRVARGRGSSGTPPVGPPPFLRTSDSAQSGSKFATQAPTQALLEAHEAELQQARAEVQREGADVLAALRQRSAQELAEALTQQREALDQQWSERIAAAVASFEQARAAYFKDAESAVIRLALAIARRVLYRESHIDPLLLRGAVRVALEHAQEGAGCVLEVAKGQQADWERWLAAESAHPIEVQALEEVPSGHCRLLIGSSTADLSADAQLSEIERGFFDLLQSRPMVRGAETE
jgi:flagellar assembly protein FliH